MLDSFGTRTAIIPFSSPALFRRVLKIEPDNLDALIAYGVLLNSSKRSAEKGMRYLVRAIKLDPKNDIAWSHLGESLILLGEYDKAETYIRKAAKINPENAQHWHRLGNVLEKKESYKEAIKMVKKSMEMDDTEETTWISLGRIYEKQNMYSEAHDAYTHALALDPNNQHIKSAMKKVESLLEK